MHIVLIRFHMFFDDILLGRCSGISSGITFACISNKYLWHLAWLQIHYMTEKINFPPFPSLSSSAQRRVQVTFWQAGHKGMYDILITVYELSPGNQVSSSIYSFAILCFCYDPVQGLLNAYVHYICTSKQILAVTQICSLLVCYIFWAANPFQQDTMGVGIPNKILHWNVSMWRYYNIE